MNADDAPNRLTKESLFPSAREHGTAGEAAAAAFLADEKGFAILERNWRNPDDLREEIDLVARDGAVLVFVEVKTRLAGARVPGYYAVDRDKRAVLRRAARSYLRKLRPRPRTFRLDVVEIERPPGGGELRFCHFRNVPLFLRYERA